MAKAATVYVCDSCGGEALKWQGQCPHCGNWNSLSRVSGVRSVTAAAGAAPAAAAVATDLQGADPVRHSLGGQELDRVFGGGVCAGSVTLLGGEPGIGKSTLLLQVAAALAGTQPVVYASGEESTAQIAARARRLGLASGQLQLASEASLDAILALANDSRAALLVIDSIQTVQLGERDGAPGSLTQLRECTAALVRHAKSTGMAVVLVGHVTKEGSIAGPKLLEHLVDTVLYFEADAGSRYRLLRAAKNRFGPVNELGFFLMTGEGLREVRNPSAIFLARGETPAPGSVVMVARDGGRPLLVEVQALVDRSRQLNPRRVAQGLDATRLALLLAVLSRHGELPLQEYDVFANLVGGLEIRETATDLPVALALASSLAGRALPATLACFGELGLTGEVRPVPHGEERLRELAKQGFDRVILPKLNAPRDAIAGMRLWPVATLAEALQAARQLSG